MGLCASAQDTKDFDSIPIQGEDKGDNKQAKPQQKTDIPIESYPDGLSVKNGCLVGSPIHKEIVFDACFTNDPFVYLTCSDDKTVVRYDWFHGKVLNRWNFHTKSVNKVRYAHQLDYVLTASRDTTVGLIKLTDTQPTLFKGHTLNVQALDINPVDNNQFVSGSRDYSVRFWDINQATSTNNFSIHQNVVTALKWVPSETCVIQTSEDLIMRAWDPRMSQPAQIWQDGAYFALCCDVSPDGRYIVTSHNGFQSTGCEVKIWDRRKPGQQPLSVLGGHSESVPACAFVEENPFNTYDPADDENGELGDQLNGQGSLGVRSSCTVDERRASGMNIKISYMHHKDAKPEDLHEAHRNAGYVPVDEQLYVVTASKDQSIKLWDLKTGNIVTSVQIEHSNTHNALAYFPPTKASVQTLHQAQKQYIQSKRAKSADFDLSSVPNYIKNPNYGFLVSGCVGGFPSTWGVDMQEHDLILCHRNRRPPAQ